MTWLGTVSGKKIDLLNPDPQQITLEDIAFALDNIPRFNGHTTQPWTVLDHSVAVARLVAPHLRLQALLHDASEAYICDMPSPLKRLIGAAYVDVERRIQGAIGWKFGVSLVELDDAVKQADAIMLMTEHQYFQPAALQWGVDYSGGVRAPRGILTRTTPAEFCRWVDDAMRMNTT